MSLWRELILRYHTSFKIKTLVVHDCPLWKNEEVGRELSGEAIAAVVKDFIKRYVSEPLLMEFNWIFSLIHSVDALLFCLQNGSC